jgi:adenylate kinase family enzyme
LRDRPVGEVYSATFKTNVGKTIADEFKLTHVSIQSILNNFVSENHGDEDAIEIRQKLLAGHSPSDEITNALVAARLARKDANDLGVIIDGYPSTEAQVQYLRQTLGIEPNVVFMLECSDNFVFSEQSFVDPVTGVTTTLEGARASGDHALLLRINQLAEEGREAMQNNIERWELCRRNLLKHFEHKAISVSLEGRTEHQILEHITQILRKKF